MNEKFGWDKGDFEVEKPPEGLQPWQKEAADAIQAKIDAIEAKLAEAEEDETDE